VKLKEIEIMKKVQGFSEDGDDINWTFAIPPEDYKGSQANWHIALIERGLWDGEGWHGDVNIPSDVWWEILEQCEG
jgi:hypothetical protein